MNRILIIAYYYPPNNNIPSWRPHSWANYFSRNHPGIEVHVVCRAWTGNEKVWTDQINPSVRQHDHVVKPASNQSIHYLAADRTLSKIAGFTRKFSLLNKAFYFLTHLLGYHHIEVDAYFSHKKYIKKTFPKDFFDVVIITSPPINLVRLGYSLRNHFPKAFFVADFRDLWHNDELKLSYSPPLRERFDNSLYKKSIAKWLKKYDLLTGISQPLVQVLKELRPSIPGEVIKNGYEETLFCDSGKKGTDTFTIASIGTIYPAQSYDILVRGIIDFVKNNGFSNSIKIRFIGTRSFNPGLVAALEKQLPLTIVEITDRIDRKDAISIMVNANALVYPVWSGYKGIYSGKIFEYLASGNNILIAPGDNDVIQNLLDETKSGVSCNTSGEVSHQLQVWYDEWKVKGIVSYHGIKDRIQLYSRENQAKKLFDIIQSKFSSN